VASGNEKKVIGARQTIDSWAGCDSFPALPKWGNPIFTMAEQPTISDEPSAIGGVDGMFKAGDECPLRRVLAIREHGLVLESARAFEVGSAMMLGCHVDRCGADVESGFVSAEVIVVDSQVMVPGENRHQVTVLFSEISCEDRETLLALPDADGIRLSPPRSRTGRDGGGRRAGLAIPPPEVFSIAQSSVAQSVLSSDSQAKLLEGNEGASQGSGEDSGAHGIDPAGCSLN
jgi:hypothetical protein